MYADLQSDGLFSQSFNKKYGRPVVVLIEDKSLAYGDRVRRSNICNIRTWTNNLQETS